MDVLFVLEIEKVELIIRSCIIIYLTNHWA